MRCSSVDHAQRALFAEFAMELLSSGHHSVGLTTLELSLPLGPLPWGVSIADFGTLFSPLWIVLS